jgi:hypothetical protein
LFDLSTIGPDRSAIRIRRDERTQNRLQGRAFFARVRLARFKVDSAFVEAVGFVKRYGLVRDDRHEAPPVMVPFRRSPARPFPVLPHHRLGVLPLGSP